MMALIWFGFWCWSVGKTIRTDSILDRPISVNFEENRIDTIHTYLGEQLGITIRADWEDLEIYNGIRADDLISLQLEGVPAKKILDLICESTDVSPIGWTIIHGDVVIVRSR